MLNALFLFTSFHFLQVAMDKEAGGLRVLALGLSVSYLVLVFADGLGF